ncbi:MAG: hypothetical protein RL095_2946 [Verrucomicrobiota bacterium]|jgi:outer membrane receptor protein involved in Fe transport
MRLLPFLLPALLGLSTQAAEKTERSDISLEELGNLTLASSSTLTGIEQRRLPALTTRIDREMISRCGARDLLELLDIYVPGFQMNRHPNRNKLWGTRGVDSAVKYVILLNGRKMNDNWLHGAISETLFPMLGDIESVEFVNGPGSALYGSGAIGGVINVITRDASDFLGDKEQAGFLRLSQGFINQSRWVETYYARKLNEKMTLSLYAGLNDFDGLSENDSDFHGAYGYKNAAPGERWDYSPDANKFNDPLRQKYELRLDAEEFQSWVRYTRAIVGFMDFSGEYKNNPAPFAKTPPYFGIHEEQFTWHNEYTRELDNDFTLKLEGGYQWYRTTQENIKYFRPLCADAHQVFGRVTLLKDFDEKNHLAIGTEILRENFIPFKTSTRKPVTNLSEALFAEYQWNIHEDLTFFAGGRYDHDRFTEDDGYGVIGKYNDFTGDEHRPGFDVVPRLGLVWTPTDEDTIKLLYNQAMRDIQSEQFGRNGVPSNLPIQGKGEDEFTENYELIYSRRLDENWTATLNTYYNEAENLGSITGDPRQYGVIGKSSAWGAGASLDYRAEGHFFGLSHNYDTVTDFNSFIAKSNNIFVFDPYPKGAKLEYWNWSPHSSKVYGGFTLSDHFSIDGNLQVRWYYEGLEQAYERDIKSKAGAGYADNFNGNFGPSYNLNLGATWKFNDQHSLRFDAYNLIALIDRDHNTLHTYSYFDYYTMPFSFALTYEFKF